VHLHEEEVKVVRTEEEEDATTVQIRVIVSKIVDGSVFSDESMVRLQTVRGGEIPRGDGSELFALASAASESAVHTFSCGGRIFESYSPIYPIALKCKCARVVISCEFAAAPVEPSSLMAPVSLTMYTGTSHPTGHVEMLPVTTTTTTGGGGQVIAASPQLVQIANKFSSDSLHIDFYTATNVNHRADIARCDGRMAVESSPSTGLFLSCKCRVARVFADLY
jgi:hypothetical protein